MSILDDAIREHLELKRAHGADDAELKRLEDEAFGPPQRPDEPDPFAEAPTEFLATPEGGAEEAAPAAGGRREPNITDLQEAPPRAEPEPAPDAEAAASDDGPAEEEHPAGEHETIAEPGPTTEERHAIASQPTEIFDVEGQFEQAPPEADAPSDEQLAEAEQAEPRLAPAAAEDEPADEFDEFFSEQRLSDELNAALEAPLPDEPGGPATEEAAVYVDTDAEEPEAEEGEHEHEVEPAAGQDSREFELVEEHEEEGSEPREPAPPAADSAHHDPLEETPDFLEESPEDDDLWFEQKPPKDIDFGD